MRKWWLLCVFLVLWQILGHALAHRSAPAPSTARTADAPTVTRIVSMAPNLTELLYALDLGEAIVGVTQGSDCPAAATEKPMVGTFWQPNIEAIIACKPDLVTTLTFQQHQSLATRLQRMGYRCLSTEIWTVDDLFSAIETIGRATGRGLEADQLAASLMGRIRALQQTLENRGRPRVLWVVQRDPLRVAGRDTFVNELIELAGGENAIGPTLHKYPPIGTEQVLAADVEVIIEPAMVRGDLSRQRQTALAHWRRLAMVPAVSDERIYVIDGDIVSRLGPRLYQGVETIARCLHPNVFGD